MYRLPVIFLFLLTEAFLAAQAPVGSWTDHLSYNHALHIAVGSRKIFVAAGEALVEYDREYGDLKKLSRTNGLSDTGIDAIGWSESTQTLIIGYSNTNVDLLINSSVYNIPDILNKYIPERKAINRIRTDGKYAYLACSFGIVVIDLAKKEVYDTWNPASGEESNEVLDVSVTGDMIYAATGSGVFRAGKADQGLSFSGNWNRNNSLPEPSGNYNAIVNYGENVFVNKSDALSVGDSIFLVAPATGLLNTVPGVFNISMDKGSDGFTVSSGSIVRYFGPSGNLIKTISGYGFATPDVKESVADRGDIWIADEVTGFVRGKNMTEFSELNIPGPLTSRAFFITSMNGRAVICGGGTDATWNSLGQKYEVSEFFSNKWTNYSSEGAKDPVRSFIDPGDGTHFYVSSWGGGLFEYRNNLLINHYDDSNSPLRSVQPGKQMVRVGGMAMDRNKFLWMTQSGVSGSLRAIKPDGNWINNSVTIDAPVIGDIIITKAGHKWITLPGGYGIFITDDNGTPENANDDRNKKLVIKDPENQIITAVFSIAEDLDGNIWIGTDQGPLVYYSPENVFDEDLRANRIKVPRNDGSGLSDYLLRTENVTTLAVDGSNRKWFGTAGSGAFYASPDGTRQIKSFNIRNSPILSDSVSGIAVDNKTGEVWFGTAKGLQSYRGLATQGGEKFTHVYAFPNPVREDFDGSITITGLMTETRVKITDISGNLVFETISDGGQAAWDLRTYNGKQVTTGVYLIFCSSSDGTESVVTKLLVIRR